MSTIRPLAIYHEHPDWFRPLFAELDKRGIPYERLDAAAHAFDPSARELPWSLVFNRASPSAYLRGHGQTTFYTLHWLRHLERLGVPVVNGVEAYVNELSKATQLDLLRELGLPFPRSRVINHASQALAAADGLRYPILVKANVGGSGAGIVKYENAEALSSAIAAETVDLGVDGTALVQEAAPLRNGHITRVETLNGKYLYAINVYPTVGSFDLCPADACQTTSGAALVRGACAIDAPKSGMRVERADPPAEIIAQVERISQAAGIDVGGIEYLVDDRDGQHYFYDVNALSNFVADAVNVVGFDPFVQLVDYLEVRAGLIGETV
ncbi:RimK family alpha-L-glutamate ligase [Gemmatimonas sp.]|jgi:glutathione synthase/RimK-type ligase-like ATP-grasp enzyme|uniref:RimK family alpha-L-glutamate ligase n=1 Tax=Gemmatimonas sp. TaxID=1962908 RepID=UPI0037BF75A8